jgi:quercetin dioxygenase-like cupin family protein
MIINRWQAPITPTKEQLKIMFDQEGLEPFEENFPPGTKITDHRHPFGEVRTVVTGELLFSVAGNQFLLRPGDRVEVPANTRHTHVNNGSTDCLCVVAQRPF